MAALLFFIITVVGYALWWLIVPAVIGAIFHLWSIIDAARFKAD